MLNLAISFALGSPFKHTGLPDFLPSPITAFRRGLALIFFVFFFPFASSPCDFLQGPLQESVSMESDHVIHIEQEK